LINIDGELEIETIDRLARQNGHKQQVGLRVVSSVGWKSKFGFSIESGHAFRAYQRINELQNLIPCGLHFHLGTGINNTNLYLRAIQEAIDLSMLLKDQLGITLRYFDFGGGFDVPTVRSFSNFNRHLGGNYLVKKAKVRKTQTLSEYGRAVTELFARYYPPSLDDPPTIVLEPGRAITSSAQSLLLKVLDIKRPRNGIAEVILDGGNNFAPPLNWEYHEVFHASNMKAPPDKFYTLFGPLCMLGDALFQIKRLPLLERDHILAIMDAGAYFTSMQSNFCFFPRPPVVLVKDLRHKLIRKRETFEDMIAQDIKGQWRDSKKRH
jgi:diaminopimelate decarboxylase